MKLISTKDYLLLIDEEAEIFQMDYYLDVDCDTVARATLTLDQYSGCKKIIAYYPLSKEAKELDLPLLPNPFKEDNPFLNGTITKATCYTDNGTFYIEELKKLFETQSNKQFSLEDMIKAIEMAREADSIDGTVDLHIVLNYPNADNSDLRIKWTEEEIIQSLSTQQLPKEFIVKYEYKHVSNGKWYNECGLIGFSEKRLKTITNSEGKQELVGKYIS